MVVDFFPLKFLEEITYYAHYIALGAVAKAVVLEPP